MAGLPNRFASASLSATKMWRSTPIAVPPGNSAFGCAGPPRLASACLKASMLVLANGVGPKLTKCMPCSPAQVAPVVLEEPYQKAGCGCCSGLVILAGIIEAVGSQACTDAVECIDEDSA